MVYIPILQKYRNHVAYYMNMFIIVTPSLNIRYLEKLIYQGEQEIQKPLKATSSRHVLLIVNDNFNFTAPRKRGEFLEVPL